MVTELGKRGNDSLPVFGIERIISYNEDGLEMADGIKVRYKLRVVTGARARAVEQAQAQVIKEVLEWSRQHRQRQGR
jgi:hypothetical protein